jgi:hypothetical protein
MLERLARVGAFCVAATAALACTSEIDVAADAAKGAGGTGSATSSIVATTAVGTTGSGANEGAGGKPSDVYPAPHGPVPQVVNYGGPVLKTPKIVPVFFEKDDQATVTKLIDFTAKVGLTSYWKQVTAEYGVGVASSLAPIVLSETLPSIIDDTAIQSWLKGKLHNADPAFPIADENTLFIIYYPAGVTITDGGGGKSCSSFGGYHSNVTLDAAHGNLEVAYAVMPRCNHFGDLTGLDAVTGPASHELIEAATDPYPMTNPAYAMIDTLHYYWVRVLGGGETADLCAQFQGSFLQFDELPYVVQRSWSNKSAKAGHDPCVPTIPGEVYFNAVPHLDKVAVSVGNQMIVESAVKIGLGESKTIDLDLFSDGPMEAWDVDVIDGTGAFGGQPRLDLNLHQTSGVNGQKLHLDIKVLQVGKNKTESFIVKSSNGQRTNLWIGLVASN